MEFRTTLEIDAPADVVAGVMIDIDRWPEWTPTVTRVERLDGSTGPLVMGARLRVVQPKVPPADWTVTALDGARGFAMTARSPGATIVADHWAESIGDGRRARVTLSLRFAGWLGRMVAWLMRGLIGSYVAQEGAGLKRRSEERARATNPA